jgi:LacI family transcriptional regulator
MDMERITQEDVAKAAGVTRATVSYVLNDRTNGNVRISEETRLRVLKAVEELGYRVNFNARSLKTNRTQLIAMLVQDLGNPFYPMLIRGAQLAAQEYGYRMIIFDSSASAKGEDDFVDMALHHIADGLLLSSFYLDASDIKTILDDEIPCVGLGPSLIGMGIDVITADQSAAVDGLIDHLVDRGHTRIAHMTGDLDTINGRIRLEAYRKAIAAHGQPPVPEWEVEGNFLREGSAERVLSWYFALPEDRRPSAMFAANDVMAIEATKALRKRGVEIPGQLAVCGYDDIPEAQYVEPALTTVGQDSEAFGREATRLLIERIEKSSAGEPVYKTFPTELHIREST